MTARDGRQPDAADAADTTTSYDGRAVLPSTTEASPTHHRWAGYDGHLHLPVGLQDAGAHHHMDAGTNGDRSPSGGVGHPRLFASDAASLWAMNGGLDDLDSSPHAHTHDTRGATVSLGMGFAVDPQDDVSMDPLGQHPTHGALMMMNAPASSAPPQHDSPGVSAFYAQDALHPNADMSSFSLDD